MSSFNEIMDQRYGRPDPEAMLPTVHKGRFVLVYLTVAICIAAIVMVTVIAGLLVLVGLVAAAVAVGAVTLIDVAVEPSDRDQP